MKPLNESARLSYGLIPAEGVDEQSLAPNFIGVGLFATDQATQSGSENG
jgi:hypothetical protein